MTNILIADDHTMFVDGMESILKDEVDFFVIGRSYDGPSVIQFINEESFVSEILNNGAKGYILKNTGREELLKAIRTVAKGDSYFSNEVTETIMKGLMNQRKASSKNNAFFPKLSRREKEVLKLIAQEFTTQEIADNLYISLKTVESHRSSLLSKLNARNSVGLVRIAMENHLLE